MKHTSLLVLPMVCVLLSCGSPVQSENPNKTIVVQAIEAMNNQQFDAFDQFFAQDLVRHCQATPDVQIRSLEEMVEFVRKWTTGFPDAKMNTKLIVAEGSLVAWYGSFVGTNEGPIGDVPATGRMVDSETFVFFRIEEGKIAEMWVTWDNVALLQQLGLFPETVSGPDPETP